MVLRGIEDRLERVVEGTFARVFRSGLQPVEVSRRLVKEIDANRAVDVNGHLLAPNRFEVALAPDDFARFEAIRDSLSRELTATVRRHAQTERLRFLGRVVVTWVTDDKVNVGRCRVSSAFDDSASLGAPPAYLTLPDGATLELGPGVLTVGRLADCHLVVADPNTSRHHAELRPEGDTYAVVDLGSTNGTRVNGRRVQAQLLADGDEITFGARSVRFHLL